MTATDLADALPLMTVKASPGSGKGRAMVRGSIRVFRLAIGVMLLLVLAYWIFEGPVASLWYQTRQDHLATDFNVARSHVEPGQAVAVLQVPVIGLNITVGEGDSPGQLRAGPGHRPGTPLPGSLGNSVVFGHEHAWGGPFDALSKLHVGDQIYVESQSKQTSMYVVTSTKRFAGTKRAPLAPTTDTRLTLVTGTGGRFGDGRLIVTAVTGRIGHAKPIPARLSAAIPKGSLLVNGTVGSFLLCVLLAVGLVLVLRRSHRPATVAIVTTPLVLAALLAILIEFDLFLTPLA